VPLKVLPAGINYSSFRKYGKKIIVRLGRFIEANEFEAAVTDGEKNRLFNQVLQEQLQPLVFNIAPGDTKKLREQFGTTTLLHKCLLALPDRAGAPQHDPAC